MISSSKKLNRMARKWQKMIAKGRKRISLLGMSNAKVIAGDTDEPSVAEKGHFVIYTTDPKRHVVPLSYLRNNIFVELLKLSAEEFGLSIHGPIVLPCDSTLFKYIVSIVQQGMERHMENYLEKQIGRSTHDVFLSYHLMVLHPSKLHLELLGRDCPHG
ncbi:hypothetical protein V6N13_090180 [Hibiscus sabdariffa]|uniref:Uncharacterized protein n=1 Tax=Hibiscus sabdariffa TaxID=183260 RepID=A0ABR2QHK3_9ROSI